VLPICQRTISRPYGAAAAVAASASVPCLSVTWMRSVWLLRVKLTRSMSAAGTGVPPSTG